MNTLIVRVILWESWILDVFKVYWTTIQIPTHIFIVLSQFALKWVKLSAVRSLNVTKEIWLEQIINHQGKVSALSSILFSITWLLPSCERSFVFNAWIFLSRTVSAVWMVYMVNMSGNRKRSDELAPLITHVIHVMRSSSAEKWRK